jgi:hypothetical protein
MSIRTKIATLVAVALLLLKPAFAEMPMFSTVAEYESAGYQRVESLDILLLAQQKTGFKLDPEKLLDATGDGWSGTLRQRYESYKHSKDRTERFEMSQIIGYDLKDRQAAISRARGYLLPLKVSVEQFSAARGGLPLSLSLDVYPASGRRSYQCAGLQARSALAACLSASNLETGDPIFDLLPMPDANIAAQVKGWIESRRLILYALGVPNSPYQGTSAIPSDLTQRGVTGNQPTTIVELLLVDSSNNKVLNTARTQPTANNNPQTAQPAQPAPPNSPVQPGNRTPLIPPISKGFAIDGMPVPPIGDPGPQGNGNPPPGGPAEPGDPPPLPTDDQIQTLDRLLSWLSYTVYASLAQVKVVENELHELEMKYARIENDADRNVNLKPLELQKLTKKIEGKQRKREHLQSMLELKQQIPAKFGAQRLDGPKIAGITYERYRLADQREVVVFRGTSGAQDLETDFQLAMTPETVAEITKGLGEGQSMAIAFANKVRDGQAPENGGKPEAFLAADRLIASIIRGGVPAKRLILTGHSLGGGLAQYAGIHQGVSTVVTFNTTPLNVQLRHSLEPSKYSGIIRNYISTIPSVMGDSIMDPVSQSLGSKDVNTLQVIGPQYTVEVCNDLENPDFKSFVNTAQGFITRTTVSSFAGDKYKGTRRAMSAAGAAAGYTQASTDASSAGITGYKASKKMANGVVATMNCVQNPFLCSAKAVAGGVASISADVALSKIWTLYSAHRMQGLFDAMNGYADPGCTGFPSYR